MKNLRKGIALLLVWLIFSSPLWSQDVTDKTFKDKTKKGFVVIKFTSKWQEKKLDPTVLSAVSAVKGYEQVVILAIKSEKCPKVAKKLRLRNFPSVVLFYNGKKEESWKADMDGNLELTDKYIRDPIDDVLAGDVF